jgi:hypothetical protein
MSVVTFDTSISIAYKPGVLPAGLRMSAFNRRFCRVRTISGAAFFGR